MPIPQFDFVHDLIPPHNGDPTDPDSVSPYPCTLTELVEVLGFTNERRQIIHGFLRLRRELLTLGLKGFQWIDGSFCELKEWRLGVPPNDIDVVTFITAPDDEDTIDRLVGSRLELIDSEFTKGEFLVDHYVVPLPGRDYGTIIAQSTYWHGLFSHRRGDEIQKGMLQIDLNSTMDDALAAEMLGGIDE